MPTMMPRQVPAVLAEADRILCLAHREPDGDAYGSLLALRWILEAAGKQVVTGIDGPPDQTYQFLPGYQGVRTPDRIQGSFDLVVIADCSSVDRIGGFQDLEQLKQLPWLVIDHHPTNEQFGTPGLNWVDASCLSTCNLVLQLAEALGRPLSANAKKCLLVGMLTDSLCFRIKGVDQTFMREVMKVMGPDSYDFQYVVSRTLGFITRDELQLQSLLLSRMQLDDGVLWVGMTSDQATGPQGKRLKTRGIIQRLAEVDEARVAVLFREAELDGGRTEVKCSLRCDPDLDVSRLALDLGGGGHQLAAGCKLAGSLDVVVPEVIARIKDQVLGLPVGGS